VHAVVCIKEVPDTTELRINPETGTLVREGVPAIINPHDVHALEAALQLRDRFGGSVTVISMGPPSFIRSLRRALSLGADRAILISDRAMGGADTFATSRVLAQAIRKIEAEIAPVDVVLCGRQTIDGDTAQVGPGIAARLDWPVLTYVMAIRSVDFDRKEIVVERKLERSRQVVWSKLPAVLTVEKELNEPRYAPLPRLIEAMRAEIPIWNREALGLERQEVGLLGSPTIVAKSFVPPPIQRRRTVIDAREDPDAAVAELVERLFADERFRSVVLGERGA
jgi:electron transfer flavoprotein beta subunit